MEELTGNVFEDMAEFDKKYGFDKVKMTPRFLAFRMRFLLEEVLETIKACEYEEPEQIVDGLIDLIVVAAGTLTIAGVDSQKAWNEVRRANMEKVRLDNPNRHGSGGADLVKPNGWEAPDHSENIGCLGEIMGGEFTEEFSHSVTVLLEASMMQFKKNADYGSQASGIKRGDYFIHGLDDFEYELNKKHLRFRSLIAKLRNNEEPNYESIQDTSLDIINYHSFVVAFLGYKLEGQSALVDFFGRSNEPTT